MYKNTPHLPWKKQQSKKQTKEMNCKMNFDSTEVVSFAKSLFNASIIMKNQLKQAQLRAEADGLECLSSTDV